jgi:hypothetical protein
MLTFPQHESFIKEIVAAIPFEAKQLASSLPEAERDRLAPWTKAVKKVIEQTGDKFGKSMNKTMQFSGTSHSEDKPAHEWLLDAVLSEENRGVLVAVESEFSERPAHICYDFRKLLSIKAPLKILIIDSRKNLSEVILTGINECAQRFEQHQMGEVYYVLDFHQGRVDVHRWQIGDVREGKAPKFKFEHLSNLSGPELISAA